jgi:predicted extracellular nuclease
MKRRLLRSLLGLYLLCGLTSAQAEQIVLGSWNIENLGGQREPSPLELARHIGLVRADILAIQEIHDTGPGLSNTILDQVMLEMNKAPHQNWTYRLFPNKAPNQTQRLCGVAWNQATVEAVGESYRIPIEDDLQDPYPIWNRHPYATQFRTRRSQGSDLVLIPVHMKSNRRPKGKSESFTREQRALEAETLVQSLAAVIRHFADKDIVIVGDTNCLNVDEPALRKLRDAGFRDLNLADQNTHRKGRAPFDRFFLPIDEPEFQDSRQMLLYPTAGGEYEALLSDHYLILTTMELLVDDD